MSLDHAQAISPRRRLGQGRLLQGSHARKPANACVIAGEREKAGS